MYVCVRVGDNIYDFWNVRSWDYSGGINGSKNLWIFFFENELPDGSPCGYIESAVVESSFIPDKINDNENDPNNLLLLK